MIYTYQHIKRDLTLEADLCVIGTGAGGGPVIHEATQQGKRVVALEAGSFFRPRPPDFSQLEHEMFPRLYHEKGGRGTTDKAIQVHQGRGVGGSTLHNLNICARLPRALREIWREEHGLAWLTDAKLDAMYDEIEQRLSVSTIAAAEVVGSSLILKRGSEALGYRGGPIRHNRVNCAGSGFCEIGCPHDAKQNSLKVFIAPAVEQGATVLADTWAIRIETQGSKANRVIAATRDPDSGEVLHTVTVKTRAVCVSASGTGSAALLQRSDVPDPDHLIGSRLHLHPGAGIAGIFDEELRSWDGIPQSYECTEFLDFRREATHRTWLIPAFAHPAGVSAMLSGFGEEHGRYLAHYPRMAALSPMVHDETSGSVRPNGDFSVSIDYWLDRKDREEFRFGVAECARILFAAGARRVVVPFAKVLELKSAGEIDDQLGSRDIRKHDLVITSVHPMSSVWMGDDAESSCVDRTGRCHHADNVFVADTSIYPTSIGIAPQLTTYAMGLHVGRNICAYLG